MYQNYHSNKFEICLINPELKSVNQLLAFLYKRIDWKHHFRIYKNLAFWCALFGVFAYLRHGLHLKFLLTISAILFLPIPCFYFYWSLFFIRNKKKRIIFGDNSFTYKGSSVDYSRIKVIELSGNSNFSLTTFSFPFDYKFVGYNCQLYESIIDKIRSSGAKPEIRKKKGFH